MKRGKLCGTVAVSRTDVACPKGGVPGNVAPAASSVVPGMGAVEEGDPSGCAGWHRDGAPSLDSTDQVCAKQRAAMANEVGSDNGVVRVKLPEKGDGTKHLVRVGEWVLLWGSALEVLLGNAMEDAVAPSLPFLSTATWSTDVARRGDVHSMPSGRPVASIPDEASRDEVWGGGGSGNRGWPVSCERGGATWSGV